MKGSLSALAVQFAALSLLAFGGVNVVVPGMQHAVVGEGWMSSEEFAHLFAIAQAMPGPNVIVVPLIGWRVAGIPGAVVAATAMLLPSTALLLSVAGMWERFAHTRFVRAARAGLSPLAVGLVLASGWLLANAAAQRSVAALLLTGLATLTAVRTRWHPLLLLLAGALLGLLGWV